MDPIPDPRSLTVEELKLRIEQLVSREQEVSDTRRVLHGQIDALRRELVERLRDEGTTPVIVDDDALGPGAAGVREPRTPRPPRGFDGIAIPEPQDPDVEINRHQGMARTTISDEP